ncbi:tyrosyl-DNA phosphodiesterase 1 [Selaginella moellendorffii]|nr:tyrosyl-DNA phosphodiesterase 1 [Selaginella moellendorffii]|eukprot:XP_024530041.1 tyrosyl-DNA phosphodiesterase 1 [Selaginella moellendorffii]
MEVEDQIGLLLPLLANGEEDPSVAAIPIFRGFNSVGRSSNLVVEVSSSALEMEISVTGSSSISIKSGSSAKIILSSQSKSPLRAGDIVEGDRFFKFMLCSSLKGKAAASQSDNVLASNKRKRQIEDDEAFARALQQEDMATTVHSKNTRGGEPENSKMLQSSRSPCGFQLLRVQGLPDWANAGCVRISDVIKGDVLVAILSNYMVDIEWLLSACPLLRSIPQVVMIHGESNVSQLQSVKPSNWLLFKPRLWISYGTHHSKAMLLVYPTGVRVVVHTANLINIDWNNKTQGLWMQDFPLKSMTGITTASDFENDLVDYLTALEWSGCTVDVQHHGQMKINASYFRNFDFSNAAVRLIGSIPGYHSGPQLNKWGHMKLRSILKEEKFDKKFQNSPLVYQFSSLGSLDEKWMEEFSSSLSEGSTLDGRRLGLGEAQIIFPTVEDVRQSLEGYRAGAAIPSPAKNVEKPLLKKYWSRWQAEHTGRSRAMPHIKTFVRFRENALAWVCLTSSNLSKAAWGALQKNKTQLMIRSYELGVVFLPSMLSKFKNRYSCTEDLPLINENEACKTGAPNVKLYTLAATESMDEEEDTNAKIIRLPLPYALPPPRYSSQDEPWKWDKQYLHPDVYGKRWPN